MVEKITRKALHEMLTALSRHFPHIGMRRAPVETVEDYYRALRYDDADAVALAIEYFIDNGEAFPKVKHLKDRVREWMRANRAEALSVEHASSSHESYAELQAREETCRGCGQRAEWSAFWRPVRSDEPGRKGWPATTPDFQYLLLEQGHRLLCACPRRTVYAPMDDSLPPRMPVPHAERIRLALLLADRGRRLPTPVAPTAATTTTTTTEVTV